MNGKNKCPHCFNYIKMKLLRKLNVKIWMKTHKRKYKLIICTRTYWISVFDDLILLYTPGLLHFLKLTMTRIIFLTDSKQPKKLILNKQYRVIFRSIAIIQLVLALILITNNVLKNRIRLFEAKSLLYIIK